MLPLMLILALLSFVQTESTGDQKCVVHAEAMPVNTLIEGCTDPPCSVQPDVDTLVHMSFTSRLTMSCWIEGQPITIQKCVINPGPLPVKALVEGCTNPRCVVPPGGEAIFHLTFEAPHVITSMETLVTLDFPGLGLLSFPLEDYAATCNYLTNSSCPVPAGEVLQYSLRLKIPAILNRASFLIEVHVVDQHKNSLLCMRVPVKVA